MSINSGTDLNYGKTHTMEKAAEAERSPIFWEVLELCNSWPSAHAPLPGLASISFFSFLPPPASHEKQFTRMSSFILMPTSQ